MTDLGFIITKKQQLEELTKRVPPILNVDIVVFRRRNSADKMVYPEFLIGRRNPNSRPHGHRIKWLFPGGRMRFDEIPQQTAQRILQEELPGVNAQIKKIIAAHSDKGYDNRAYGITLSYLLEYVDGEPQSNKSLDNFGRFNEEEMRARNDIYSKNIGLLPEVYATIRMMNSTQDEILVEVDQNNNEIGEIEKRASHNTNKRYHRAAHIMIFNSQGQVVLQKRSLNKASHPGERDMPGGHQASGHTMEQTAAQELMEEMGISTELTLHRIGLKVSETQAEYYYLYYGISDGPFGYDSNEVSAVNSFDCQRLIDGGYNDEYSILDHVKAYTQELRFVREPLLQSSVMS